MTFLCLFLVDWWDLMCGLFKACHQNNSWIKGKDEIIQKFHITIIVIKIIMDISTFTVLLNYAKVLVHTLEKFPSLLIWKTQVKFVTLCTFVCIHVKMITLTTIITHCGNTLTLTGFLLNKIYWQCDKLHTVRFYHVQSAAQHRHQQNNMRCYCCCQSIKMFYHD